MWGTLGNQWGLTGDSALSVSCGGNKECSLLFATTEANNTQGEKTRPSPRLDGPSECSDGYRSDRATTLVEHNHTAHWLCSV